MPIEDCMLPKGCRTQILLGCPSCLIHSQVWRRRKPWWVKDKRCKCRATFSEAVSDVQHLVVHSLWLNIIYLLLQTRRFNIHWCRSTASSFPFCWFRDLPYILKRQRVQWRKVNTSGTASESESEWRSETLRLQVSSWRICFLRNWSRKSDIISGPGISHPYHYFSLSVHYLLASSSGDLSGYLILLRKPGWWRQTAQLLILKLPNHVDILTAIVLTARIYSSWQVINSNVYNGYLCKHAIFWNTNEVSTDSPTP